MSKEPWEIEFETLIGKPVSGERIKEFIRNLLKQKENESKKRSCERKQI